MSFNKGDDTDPSTSKLDVSTSEEERDEIKEVQKLASKETNRIFWWRIILTGCLVATAAAITGATYARLHREQEDNFQTAYTQFARTVGDSVLEQQYNIREGFKSLADTISAVAKNSDMEWPFFNMDQYEVQGQNFLIQSGAEFTAMHPLVKNQDYEAWIRFVNQTYEEATEQAHMIKYGSLNRLDPNHYKPFISKAGPNGFTPDLDDRDYYFPSWLNSPPPSSYRLVNWNVYTIPDYGKALEALLTLKYETVASPVRPYQVAIGSVMTEEEHAAMHSQFADSDKENPHTFYFHPIREDSSDMDSPVVGVVGGGIAWDRSLLNLLPTTVKGIQTVIKNTCNQSFTYEISGKDAFFLGDGDLHNPSYDDMEWFVDASPHTHPEYISNQDHCKYTVHIYPTDTFHSAYDTNTPEIYAVVIATTFAVIILVFFVYDMLVQRRNNKLIVNTARSNAIVSSLFPSNIRDRLIGQDADKNQGGFVLGKSKALKTFMKDGGGNVSNSSSPLADLFLETTVIFADIVGFTAWSSVREPCQVFQLLETLYGEFDIIAKRRKVFKVETVGDCYVAVTGLPEANRMHAVTMARFAREIVLKMSKVTTELEVTLGPDTNELDLRVGLHSGPVTAGVLRGERARFQLFGDTMNTCARIESTGQPGKIHVSKETADLIVQGGKEQWLQPRHDKVVAKGKGELSTFWLDVSSKMDTSSCTVEAEGALRKGTSAVDPKQSRLIDWNVEKLVSMLKEVVAHRKGASKLDRASPKAPSPLDGQKVEVTPLDEVKEILELPSYIARQVQNPNDIVIPEVVIEQIRDYVECIASMYRANPFHNFEHASHVVMSVCKLMSRIVAPDIDINDADDEIAAKLHDYTFGITSDPLTRFACAFSALIHDVDHDGIPNTQLIKENEAMATHYKNRSVAEQNSLDLSWDLLVNNKHKDFLEMLCPTPEELQRFRSLVVNSVMSTDIMDTDLKQLRNSRWDKAFKECNDEGTTDAVNRKATIVIEHLIQASDVSHTMQHWHIYRKWNERLFRELYLAYREGRAEKNPAEFWYKGEMGFLDFYVIPLAKKLKECGVFGVSSDEFLNYANQNRREWEFKGQEVVEGMINAIKSEEAEGRGIGAKRRETAYQLPKLVSPRWEQSSSYGRPTREDHPGARTEIIV